MALLPAAAATYFLIRRLRLRMKGVRWLPYEPVVDPHAPDPVEPSPWMGPVALASVLWAAASLTAATIWLAVSLAGLPSKLPLAVSVAGGSVWIGAVLTVVGGVLVGRRDARGRTLATWGFFILGMVAFAACACLLMLTQYPRLAPGARRLAFYVAVGMAAHMMADALFGSANRRIGAPPDPDREAAVRSMYCHLAGLLALTGIPGIGILGPWLLWRVWRQRDPRIDEAGRQAVNFQAPVALYAVAVAAVAAILAGLLSVPAAWTAGIAGAAVLIVSSLLTILAAIWAYDGDSFRYPLSIQMLKAR